jgi:oligopeptide/dipeptide ABC transporter ATP-binding protein
MTSRPIRKSDPEPGAGPAISDVLVQPPRTPDSALVVRDLSVRFRSEHGEVNAVSGASYHVAPGETLGIAGESGSGKSVSTLAVLGLLPKSARDSVGGEVRFGDRDLLRLSARELRAVRGAKISMIFQDPMTSLNPVLKIGTQIAEGILCHIQRPSRAQRAAAHERALELLKRVGVSAPEERLEQYPHQLSGGMRQRVMIAMAIANEPEILIADEPTTALDVTIQAQIMRLLREIQERTGVGIILITHDIRVLAQNADRLVIMYAGRVVESGTVTEILENPKHPYTLGLLRSAPGVANSVQHGTGRVRLTPIPGVPPDPTKLPAGCSFAPRCTISNGRERCVLERPELLAIDASGHASACHFVEEVPPR